MTALDMMQKIVDSFCNPTVPLMANDFEFVIKAYNSLRNYAEVVERKTVTRAPRPDKMCQDSTLIVAHLVTNAKQAGYAWIDSGIQAFLLTEIAQTINKNYPLFELDGRPPQSNKRQSVQSMWQRFRANNPNKQVVIAFTLLTLYHEAAVNGVVQFGPKK